MNTRITLVTLLALLSACSAREPTPPAAQTQTPTEATAKPSAIAKDIPAGAYELDPSHATLLFRVDHLGFSHYTARFKRFNAKLQFDPQQLASAQLEVSVDPRSIETDFPDPAKLDFNGELQGAQWLDVATYPELTWRSTNVAVTGANTMRVTGDLTLHGVTKPVVLDATFNGGYSGHPMDPRARIGFSGRGTFKRSDFGIGYGIPAPGTTMGVSDEVEVIVEVEFSGPPLAGAAPAAQS